MSKTEFIKEGEYLYHPNYGVGKVIATTGGDYPDLTIAFERDPRRNISAAHASRATIRLSSQGFRALAYEDPTRAEKLLKEGTAEAVKRVLYDFPNHQAKTIDIREYLAPYLDDWDDWWKPTQKLLKESPFIDSTRSKDQIYALRAEMLSPAEEAYSTFQETLDRIPISQALTFNDPRYERARQTLKAIAEGYSLTEEQEQELQDFFRQVWKNKNLPKPLRVDAVYRSLEQEWISPEDAASEVLDLLPLDEGLVSLSRFAQNRLVEHLTLQPRSEEVDRVLLSGLVISLEAGETIEVWVRNQLDSDLDKHAILILLQEIEKIVQTEISPGMLSTSIRRLNRLLDLAPGEETFWCALPEKLNSVIKRLVKLPDARLRKDLSRVFVELTRSVGKLYSRKALFENGNFTNLMDLLSAWENPTEVRAALLRGLGEPDLPPNFREEMLETYAAGISTDQDAKQLVEESGVELENLVELAEQAVLEGDYSPSGAAQFLAAIASEQDAEELDDLLPLFNRIVALGDEDDEWVRLLNTHRSKVYRTAIQQVLSGETIESIAKPGLDPIQLHLFKEQFEERTSEIRSKMDELENLLAERDERIKSLERSVQTQKGTVSELGEKINIAQEEVRYKERLKLAGDLVRSVAEMERFFSKQVDTKKEVEAIFIRMHSFLSAFGVEPLYAIGEEIAYDPQLCQLISELPKDVEGEIRVLVRERGYRIRDLQGEMKLLKPAIVEPASQ